MSLSKINLFANDDSDILAVQTTVDALYNNAYSLTEFDSTTVPAIAIGSKIEVGGAYYLAEAEEAISTTDPVTTAAIADGTVYVCMIPSGDGLTCTAAFTATAPTWSHAKQGWYGTGGQVTYKYLNVICNKATAVYKKHTFGRPEFPRFFNLISGTGAVNFSAGVNADLVLTMVYDFLSEKTAATDITIDFSGFYSIDMQMNASMTSSTETYKDFLSYILVNGSEVDTKETRIYTTSVPANFTQSNVYKGFLKAGDVIKFRGNLDGANGGFDCVFHITTLR